VAIVFTDRELDVMAVLWQAGSGTVAEVREALADDLAYTTVLTILRTLQDKGYVRPVAEGRAHRYFPAVTQQQAGKSVLARVLDKVFAGSSESLLTQLVSDRSVDPDELRRLRKLLDDRLGAVRKRRGKR
jgi:predicted transcriptional regulator